jgi:hypothetical protein
MVLEGTGTGNWTVDAVVVVTDDARSSMQTIRAIVC